MVFYCYLPIFATQERKRTHNTESSSIQRKRGITEWSPSTEKRKRRRKKKEEEEATADNEGVIGDCVGNLLAVASTGHRSCFVVFFFFHFFFFEELVFFFSGSFFFPYKSLCSISEIIRSPFDLYSSSCFFISSRSDHNFIPMYWPKFTGKLKQKEAVRTSKTCHSSQNRTVGPRSVRVPAFLAWNSSSP